MKKRRKNAMGILLVAFMIFAMVLGGLIYRKYHTATRTVQPPTTAAQAETVVVTLFFASADGKGLVREGREVELEGTIDERIESVVDELVSGPLGSAPTLPSNARVLDVRLNGDVAQIDFGHELKEGIPSGSSAEMAAVYSIVDTVTTNFPQVKAVQILVEGAPVDSLGHLDLKDPLQPDYSLEQK